MSNLQPHHCFTAKANGIANVLASPVSVALPFHPSKPPGNPGQKDFTAIWDTGASASVITSRVVKDCGLKPIGMTEVHTASGKHDCSVYLVSIFLPNRVIIPTVRVTEGILGPGGDILIGMDIINQGDFAVTNYQGKTTFSFRLPSAEHIDFVAMAGSGSSRVISPKKAKVGRNDPCPCGSGLKYKKCHGKNV